jgi:hypothetical protein
LGLKKNSPSGPSLVLWENLKKFLNISEISSPLTRLKLETFCFEGIKILGAADMIGNCGLA